MGFLRVCFYAQFGACAFFLASPFGKTSIFRSSAGMLHGREALQCLSFYTAACRHFQSMWPCCIAFWSTTVGSGLSFILWTSSLKMIRKPLHPPFSTGCSRACALSSRLCLFANSPDRCLLLVPIRRPAKIIDSRCASRDSPFFSTSLSCSPKTLFLSFSCLVFCQAQGD